MAVEQMLSMDPYHALSVHEHLPLDVLNGLIIIGAARPPSDDLGRHGRCVAAWWSEQAVSLAREEEGVDVVNILSEVLLLLDMGHHLGEDFVDELDAVLRDRRGLGHDYLLVFDGAARLIAVPLGYTAGFLALGKDVPAEFHCTETGRTGVDQSCP